MLFVITPYITYLSSINSQKVIMISKSLTRALVLLSSCDIGAFIQQQLNAFIITLGA